MSYKNDNGRLWGWIRGKRGRRPLAWRRARPALEALENRLTPSVGGGWISSTQSGQSGDGLLGQYYNNSTLSGTPSFTRWDDRIDFSWTDSNAYPGGSSDPGFGSVGPSDWSAKWTGTLTANFSETYTFLINSAGNGVRLWVTPVGQQQGNPLIDDWTDHGQTTDTATMTLQAGQDYDVELDLSETYATWQQVQLQLVQPEYAPGGHRARHASRPEPRWGRRAVRQHGERRHRDSLVGPGEFEPDGPDRQQRLAGGGCRRFPRGRRCDHCGRGILSRPVHRNGDRDRPVAERRLVGQRNRFAQQHATSRSGLQSQHQYDHRHDGRPAKSDFRLLHDLHQHHAAIRTAPLDITAISEAGSTVTVSVTVGDGHYPESKGDHRRVSLVAPLNITGHL